MLETAYVGKSSEKLNESLAGNPAIYIPGQSTAANVNNRRLYYPGVLGAVQDAASSGHATYHGPGRHIAHAATAGSHHDSELYVVQIDRRGFG
jgi:hypothetical protein